jgi:asparagine synthase (glutamine-hydrolysing)
MTAFAGMVAFDGGVDVQPDDAVSRAITGRVLTRRLDGGLFAQRNTSTSASHGEPQPLITRDGRALFAACARLDNREELGAALGLTTAALAQTRDAPLLLRMMERWGDSGLGRCLGAFAFALWDAEARRLILGRDCLGNRALFYFRGSGFVAFATTLKALLAIPRVPRDIDEVTLAHFMVVNMSEQRRTFYRGIERVPSRTLATIDRNGAHHRRYWAPELDARPPYSREEDYIERARELLDQAVATATADTPNVAISASGGFDSSAIAATAARLGIAKSITCYTVVPPAGTQIDVGPFKYLGERDKLEALERMHPMLKLRFFASEALHPIEEDNTRHFVRTAMPTLGAASLGMSNYLYEAVARAGHRVLLIGSFGNFGLSWSGIFSLLALLRAAKWSAFMHEWRATAREDGQGLARALAANVLMPGAPPAVRRLIRRFRGLDPDSAARYSALNPAFIAELDLAKQWRAQGFDPWFRQGDWSAPRHRAHFMFDYNQLARDTRSMSDERHGFAVRDPHADRRLLEFLLAVPEPMFRRNGVQRAFARRVLADRLPREILDERRIGVQVPAWFRRLDAKRKEIAMDIERLEASPLAARLIDLPRLKRLMSQWPQDENAAERRRDEYALALARGVHVGRFIRWVEGGNA